MNNTRKIIHVDQDCFFAAVEIRDNPKLKGRPVAVGGSIEKRGVLATANYEARNLGIRSAMSTAKALRLCPNLILIPVNFDKYKRESQKIRTIFKKFTDKIEPLSIDEVYLDVSKCTGFNGSATLIAKEIRHQIFIQTKLTASAGIAPNKFLAKIASNWCKPNGQFTITPKMVDNFVKELKIEKISGVGKITAKKMYKMGIKTCSDVRKYSLMDLVKQFGLWGSRLFELSHGVDNSEVVTNKIRKSINIERTYSSDLKNLTECLAKITILYREFILRLEKIQEHKNIKSFIMKIKFNDFKQITMECSKYKVLSINNYFDMIKKIIKKINYKPIRMLGIGVKLHNLKIFKKNNEQLKLF